MDFKKIKDLLIRLGNAKKKKDHIDTLIGDTRKLTMAASHIYKRRTNSDGVLLKLGWEVVGRLAKKSTPLLGFYIDYHDKSIGILASVLNVDNMYQFLMKWRYEFNKKADAIINTVKHMKETYGYARTMINSNGKMANNLPENINKHYKLIESDNIIASLNKMRSKTYCDNTANSREQLGLFVLETSKEIASVYLACSEILKALGTLGIEGTKKLKKLRNSKGSLDRIAAFSAEKNKQEEMFFSKNFDPDLLLFFEEKWFRSQAAQKSGKAMRELEELNEVWKRWSYNVTLDIHLESY
jgi:hypothetical protein